MDWGKIVRGALIWASRSEMVLCPAYPPLTHRVDTAPSHGRSAFLAGRCFAITKYRDCETTPPILRRTALIGLGASDVARHLRLDNPRQTIGDDVHPPPGAWQVCAQSACTSASAPELLRLQARQLVNQFLKKHRLQSSGVGVGI